MTGDTTFSARAAPLRRASPVRIAKRWRQMRTHPILLLAVGLTLAACDGTGSPPDGGVGPSTDGTLVVSTSTGGNEPDQDGYLLTVDGLDSV